MKISMIGLGKLGLPCAEAMAEQHEVAGFDVNPNISSKTIRTSTSLEEAVCGQNWHLSLYQHHIVLSTMASLRQVI